MRRAAWLTLAAFIVSAVALGLRPQLIGMALFAVDAVAGDRPPRPPGSPLGDPGHRPGLGQRPRQLLPRPARARARLARGPPRPRAAAASGCCSIAVVLGGRRLRDAVRPRRLGLRGRAVDEPGGDRADHRVAADVAALDPRHPVLRVGARGRRPHRTARPRHPVADPRLAGGLLPDRGLRDPRRGLVAARGGRRDRRRAGDGTGRRTGSARGPRLAADAPAQSGRRRGDRRWPGSRCCRSGDRSTRTSTRRPGSSASHRRASPRHCARRPARATGCSTRSRGVRGSSSPCPTCRSRSIRASSSSRPRRGTPTRTSSPAARAGRHSSTDWGVTMIVVEAEETTMADRLAAAGWRSVYADSDGIDLRGAGSVARAPSGAWSTNTLPGPSGFGATPHRAGRVQP